MQIICLSKGIALKLKDFFILLLNQFYTKGCGLIKHHLSQSKVERRESLDIMENVATILLKIQLPSN